MTHPELRELALYAGGEQPIWRRLWMRRHLDSCASCRAEVDSFREAQLELQYTVDDLPANLNWTRLAGEMKANIRVGLAAGECVRTAPDHSRHEMWRLSAVAAALALVITGGWWWKVAHPAASPSVMTLRAPAEQTEVVLKSTLGGIGLERNGATFALAHDGGETLGVSAETKGVLKSSYVDERSGEVTIHYVYAE